MLTYKKIFGYIRLMMLVCAITVVGISCKGAITADQIMQKTAATLGGTVTVSYRISGSSSGSGIIVVSGNKFFVDAGRSKIWYNGKTMTTLNTVSNEATITTPTATEVNESFPLSYLTTWRRDYTVAMATKQPSGGYCLVLTSKSASAVAKKAILTVNSANFQPRKLVISFKNGGTASVAVTSIRKGNSSKYTNSFQYPKKLYPKVKIVDLR